MFKSALYHHRNIYGAAVHTVKDDTFVTLVEVDHGGLALRILEAYRSRGLPVAPNMALFYLWCGYNKDIIERDRAVINFSAPAYRYGEKIYPCVLRQIKQRMFGKNK